MNLFRELFHVNYSYELVYLNFGYYMTFCLINFHFSAIIDPVDTYIEAGVATSLSCDVTGNDGTASYAWFKDGDDSTVLETSATYDITTPAYEQSGSYYCSVTMTVSSTANGPFNSASANLYVRGKNQS